MCKMSAILNAVGIKKSFKNGETTQKVLKGVDLELERGKLYCITGSSGSGKSTLLYILSALEKPDEGKLYLEDQEFPVFDKKNDRELSNFRKNKFSFVFQFYNLMPVLTVEENIMLPLVLAKNVTKEKKIFMEQILKKIGLYEKRKSAINLLSGGEQQRVSIARAMLSDASIMFADEPTGNLDTENSRLIYSLLKQMACEYNKTVISVTHDMDMTSYADYVFSLKDGVIA